MLYSIRDIPGNDEIIKRLKILLVTEKMTAFVGAGASAGLYPLWNELIESLANEAMRLGLARKEDKAFWIQLSSSKPQQALRGIKKALGTQTYRNFLAKVFGPKKGEDNNFYTPVHGEIVQLPFRGIVTTNYDPGLIEARMVLRHDSRATGFGTWKDVDILSDWINGNIFSDQPCPILFAHGIYERGDTVVLGAGEYMEAYHSGPYRRLFDKLWTQERLVFVGFGFTDSWLDFLAREVITQTVGEASVEPRHIALIGLPADEVYSSEMRHMFIREYSANVIFYPVIIESTGEQNHSALFDFLKSLNTSPKTPKTAPVVNASNFNLKMIQNWTHPTTNDELYIPRLKTIDRLNRWVKDTDVHVIAIVGFGGIGKTSLVGYWMKECAGAGERGGDGLFYWSFYNDRNPHSFFLALLRFSEEKFHVNTEEKLSLSTRAIKLLNMKRLIVILDGLELLQEQRGASYGTLEESLRHFIIGSCQNKHQGLVVLTSRFLFPDLTQFLGSQVRMLKLDQLNKEEGAALLANCGVKSKVEDCMKISQDLEGHPLALRISAAVLKDKKKQNWVLLRKQIFKGTSRDKDLVLYQKFNNLLAFYESQISIMSASILCVISLFRTPVSETIIALLLERLPHLADTQLRANDFELHDQLRSLVKEHFIQMDFKNRCAVYSCHPIINDHFRRRILAYKNGKAAEVVADLLSSQPGKALTIEDLELIIDAIDVLLEANKDNEAWKLYKDKIVDSYIFLELPAMNLGLRVYFGLIGTEDRRLKIQKQISKLKKNQSYICLLNNAAVVARFAGDYDLAKLWNDECLKFFKTSDKLKREYNREKNSIFYKSLSKIHHYYGEERALAYILREISEMHIELSEFSVAESLQIESLELARKIKDDISVCFSLDCYAHCLMMQGRVKEAKEMFRESKALYVSPNINVYFDSERDIPYRYAVCLIRAGRWIEARKEALIGIERAIRKKWNSRVATFNLILGQIEVQEGDYTSAKNRFDIAENTFRKGGMIYAVTEVLIARSALEIKTQSFNTAIKIIEEALHCATNLKLKGLITDILLLRGTLAKSRALVNTDNDLANRDLDRAEDDADSALMLSRQINYLWAERDVLILKAMVYRARGEKTLEVDAIREAEMLSLRLDEFK